MREVSLKSHLESSVADADLRQLLTAIADFSVPVRTEFPHRLATTADRNKYGEATAELDRWVNDFVVSGLLSTGLVRKVYSEELEVPMVSEGGREKYVVAIDPLDGSSNIISNNAFGMIFGIYKKDLPVRGAEQVAALYKVYGPMTTLVYTAGKGSHEFVKYLKGDLRFALTAENIRLPEPGKVYGLGGSPGEWSPGFHKFAESLAIERGMKNRYCGTFVADVNQVIHYGGLFAYPATSKAQGGKLRLFYEGAPVGFIVEQAGGASSNGRSSLLQVEATDPDVRTPVFVGNKKLVAAAVRSV